MTLKKILFLFLITFFVKLLSCYYLAFLAKCLQPGAYYAVIASKQGDAPGYVDPIDNFLEKGEYYFQDGDRKVSIGRAPYYGSVYFLFRLFLSKEMAYDAVAVSQILIEAIAIICLALLSEKILKNRLAFWLTYLLMMVSLNVTYWSNVLVTESLSISFLIFFAWYYYDYLTARKKRSLFLAGLFLSFAVLLKPYFLLLYIPIGILLLLEKPFMPGKFISKGLILSCSFIILSAPFAIRNYIRFNQLQPFSDFYGGYNFTKATFAYRHFVQAWGGSIVFWDKRSAACYFEPAPDIPCQFVLPEYALAKGYTVNDIERVRSLFISYKHNPSVEMEDSVTNEFNRLTALYKADKPLRSYFISPLMLVKEFIFHSGSYYLPISTVSPCYKSSQMLLKIFQSLLYYLSLFAGMAGLILLSRKDLKTYMLLFIPVFLLIFFPLIIKAPEFRYFAPSYPFLILGTVCMFFEMFRFIKKFLPDKKKT